MVSPIPYQKTRMMQSNLKSLNARLLQMEFKCHSNLVLEYQMDVLYHLLSLESTSLPSLILIEQQPDIKLTMRPLLLDFLLEVITMLNLNKSTFPLCVNLIDRYCSTRIVKKQHYQLLGLSCLWIATKFQDSKFKIPNLNDLKIICVNSYYNELFIEMEKHILKSLDWKINCSTFDSFIDLYVNIITKNCGNLELVNVFQANLPKIVVVANYFGDLFQFYPNIYFNYNSSQLAMISLFVAIITLKLPINPVSIIKFFQDILSSEDFKLCGDEAFKILSASQYHSLFNKSFYKNLIKILNNLPKSLKIKYFNGKTNLMAQLNPIISHNLTSLVEPPVSPIIHFNTSNWPLTPISNIASPQTIGEFTPNENLSSAATTRTSTAATTPYSPSSPQFKKRSFNDFQELINQTTELKRVKSKSSFCFGIS